MKLPEPEDFVSNGETEAQLIADLRAALQKLTDQAIRKVLTHACVAAINLCGANEHERALAFLQLAFDSRNEFACRAPDTLKAPCARRGERLRR